mmetsp:Transcript_60720/g.130426  ORF Transcript_60720/g.130426 Transcript_60720/m.130426 type:complete len:207 (+) Transcript_60720:417-1037(+)
MSPPASTTTARSCKVVAYSTDSSPSVVRWISRTCSKSSTGVWFLNWSMSSSGICQVAGAVLGRSSAGGRRHLNAPASAWGNAEAVADPTPIAITDECCIELRACSDRRPPGVGRRLALGPGLVARESGGLGDRVTNEAGCAACAWHPQPATGLGDRNPEGSAAGTGLGARLALGEQGAATLTTTGDCGRGFPAWLLPSVRETDPAD